MRLPLFEAMAYDGFEELLVLHDPTSGLRAFLGIHDKAGGVSFGGIRRWRYAEETHALRDCMRLSAAMTYKAALVGLDVGGAKMVVLDHPELDLEAAYRFLGRRVESLGGLFYTGPDVGTGDRELAWMAEHTRYVTRPGADGPGDLAAATAAGVFAGIGAALRHLDGEEDWERRTLFVQGLGEVGARLSLAFRQRGARVLASDVDGQRARDVARSLEIELVDPAEQYDVACDVFCPCALGGILHDLTIKRLRARIVAGAANNVLAEDGHADRLHRRGILFVPDIALSAGALLLGVVFHMHGRREPLVLIEKRIGAVIAEILGLARAEECPPAHVAVREARSRIASRRSGQVEGIETSRDRTTSGTGDPKGVSPRV